MRFLIAAVGRAKAGPERSLYDHYAGRISPPPVLKEVEEKRALKPPELKKREAELLLGAIPDGATVVALDERGKGLSSRRLAELIGRWRDEGVRNLAFVIGGADGLDDTVRSRAGLVLALGAPTWPHMLVRGLIAEQLFRTQCILSGHPYHRD